MSIYVTFPYKTSFVTRRTCNKLRLNYVFKTMADETEPKALNSSEPSMNRHKPASNTTQDISHLLASIFNDLYTTDVIGRDTVSNLSKSRRGENNYHETFVEQLQQVHSEYNRRIQNADVLETHIIQARAQAAAKEEHDHSRIMEEVGEAYYQLGLPPVKSSFKWCVDSELLRSNNLICPLDYTTLHTPVVKTPKGTYTPGFVQPTVSYNMHICTEPQDDGYTPLPPPAHTAQSLLEQSEETLTLPSSPESSSIKGTELGMVHKASWMEKPISQRQAEDRASLQKHKDRHKFLRNPRFLLPNAQRGGKSLTMPGKRPENVGKGRKNTGRESPDPTPIFTANPPVIFFTDYRIGQVYETAVELRNMTATSRHIRMMPPTSPHFSVGLGRFPGEGGMVAPGMSCQYMVRFAPDSLADYEDVLVVETQLPYPLIIPIEARRPPPILSLPAVMDCGYCLVGGVKFMEVLCRNEGLSAGTFCVMPKKQWPASSLRSAVKSTFAEQPPFAISPSIFGLLPGQATIIEVVFFPTTAEISTQDFTIVCDNCQVKDITLQGTGQLITVELVSISGGEDQPELGELCDITADHYVRFNPTNPQSTLQKTVVVKNNAHLELPYRWQIMKPNLQCLLPGETPDPSSIQHHLDTDSVFSITPVMGNLSPAEEHEFLLTYCPTDLKDYHSVCRLVIMDVPDPPRIGDDGTCLNTALHVNDVTVLEVEVKGSAEPYKILLEPYAVLIPGETYIHNTICKRFKMWNHSRSVIHFEWERIIDSHVIEVEPSSGEIEMNECFDMELALTGKNPGHFTSTLHCHIQHHPKTIGLAIEVTFKGPHCSVNLPSLDFGLLQMGSEGISSIDITNNSPLDAHWSLEELSNTKLPIQGLVYMNPNKGVLPPLASCGVDVVFRALYCQRFESVLQLTVLNGTGCHVSVQAVVQSPQVCLLSCELVLTDLYVGVPQTSSVTLFNQTLLPAHFTWSKLQGPQAHLCSATFSPSAGTLEPNAKTEVSVSFTAHTVEELTKVAAVCEVKGMESPLLLGFFSKAKPLRVSYSLHSDRTYSSDADHQPITLDFTEHEPVVIGKSIKRQLLITNHTAITAPFTVEAEYFTGYCPSQLDENSERSSAPLHSIHAKKLQQKAYDEFVNCLLSHGRGAAFFIEPNSGMLGSFETQTINITAFTNMWGDYQDNLICKVGDLDTTPIPIKMSVRGCPVYFQMIGPQPDNQNQGPVIRFGSHVSGGDTVSRSLRLINTSPYDIRMDWVTYNLEVGDSKLIDLLVACAEPFPLKDADGNEVLGGLDSSVMFPPTWDDSHTPSREGTSSTFMTKSDDFGENEEECDGEKDRSPSRSLAPVKKLFSVFLKPHEGNISDYPYCITPQQIVVPAGGSSTIHVSFTPLILSCSTNQRCMGYALGFMNLDSKLASLTPGKVERAQGYELEPLRLDMQATVKPAILSVQMADDTDVLEFTAAASDTLDAASRTQESRITRTFQLKNNTDMALSFRLSTHPPFSVLLPRQSLNLISSSPSHRHTAGLSVPGDEQASLLLQPKQILQVKVAFHNSASLLTCLNEPCEESDDLPSATLRCNDAGERTLQFQQSLTIQYSNNSVQTVSLYANLALPTLHLSSSTVDFGTCFVGQTTVKEVYLYNRGGSCSFWTTLTDSEAGNDVFRVSPDSGVLKSLGDPPSCKQLLQISFTASDQKEFQSIITVHGVLGETPLVLKVNGSGSFDESFVSPKSDT
ncbi:deleted in lung and esophageal cancer protein 1-like isoform X2 [Carassius auratus]|uniref:Deleted in lung and esophageal cancer protein 1-like isoform X2 n=1 Tax=Carassius auratus TaxID=7957 RepID=A0A6P6NCC7_CARAU|nr:deleted in lung and esophageal cancer protein 1-like isoform X2 [Carassius auratus]